MLICSVCKLEKPNIEVLMTTDGEWLCQPCQSHAQAGSRPDLLGQRMRPVGAMAIVVLAMLAVPGSMILWFLHYLVEGMRRGL